jgi:nitrite reductase/ring-hydroxylating ferredoxin subunit
MSEWVTVARTADVAEGEMLGTTVAAVEVLVANVGDEYRSVGSERTRGAFCTRTASSTRTRPSWPANVTVSVFDLETGEAVGPPATVGVPVCRVRVEGDEIQVAAPEA